MSSVSPSQLIASLFQRKIALELPTVDIAFLVALSLRAQRGALASFREDELFDVFEQVAALDPRGEGGKKRASAAIRRLRQQKLLARVDGAGLVRAGEYALSRLATAIVGFYVEEEALTRESLSVLTTTLIGFLEGVLRAAQECQHAEEWHERVTTPLRVTSFELATGIERRQRGFDLQQEELQREIAALLASDWFDAVGRCTTLLETTSATLRELNAILLGDGQRLGEVLLSLQELAHEAGQELAHEAARAAAEQVEQIAAWGGARQRAWSDYHEWVHRYLRDVVRLDPSRTLVHRLREQLAGRGTKAYALTVAHAPPFRLPRPVQVVPPDVPVRRPKRERDAAPQEVQISVQSKLETSVREALAAGSSGLAAITAHAVEGSALDASYRDAGRVAALLPRIAEVHVPRERKWASVGAEMVVEEWTVDGFAVGGTSQGASVGASREEGSTEDAGAPQSGEGVEGASGEGSAEDAGAPQDGEHEEERFDD